MPDLQTFLDEEPEDEHLFMSETKSTEEPTSQEDQIVDSIVQQSIDKVEEERNQSQDDIRLNQIETVIETK